MLLRVLFVAATEERAPEKTITIYKSWPAKVSGHQEVLIFQVGLQSFDDTQRAQLISRTTISRT